MNEEQNVQLDLPPKPPWGIGKSLLLLIVILAIIALIVSFALSYLYGIIVRNVSSPPTLVQAIGDANRARIEITTQPKQLLIVELIPAGSFGIPYTHLFSAAEDGTIRTDVPVLTPGSYFVRAGVISADLTPEAIATSSTFTVPTLTPIPTPTSIPTPTPLPTAPPLKPVILQVVERQTDYVKIGGIGEPNSQLRIFVDNQELEAVSVESSGLWQVELTGTLILPGDHSIEARHINQSEPNGGIFTFTVPPPTCHPKRPSLCVGTTASVAGPEVKLRSEPRSTQGPDGPNIAYKQVKIIDGGNFPYSDSEDKYWFKVREEDSKIEGWTPDADVGRDGSTVVCLLYLPEEITTLCDVPQN